MPPSETTDFNRAWMDLVKRAAYFMDNEMKSSSLTPVPMSRWERNARHTTERAQAVTKVLSAAERDTQGNIIPDRLDLLQQTILVADYQIDRAARDRTVSSDSLTKMCADAAGPVTAIKKMYADMDKTLGNALKTMRETRDPRLDDMKKCQGAWNGPKWNSVKATAIGLGLDGVSEDELNGRFLVGAERKPEVLDKQQLVSTLNDVQRALMVGGAPLREQRSSARERHAESIESGLASLANDQHSPRSQPVSKRSGVSPITAAGNMVTDLWASGIRKILPDRQRTDQAKLINALKTAEDLGMIDLPRDAAEIGRLVAKKLPGNALSDTATAVAALSNAGRTVKTVTHDAVRGDGEPAQVFDKLSDELRQQVSLALDAARSPSALSELGRQGQARTTWATDVTLVYDPQRQLATQPLVGDGPKKAEQLRDRIHGLAANTAAQSPAAPSRAERVNESIARMDPEKARKWQSVVSVDPATIAQQHNSQDRRGPSVSG